MEKLASKYYFKGNTEEIINSILSLLFGKEFYQEASFYSNFVNESNPESYRKKLKAILDHMQRENLILIREQHEENSIQMINMAGEITPGGNDNYSSGARIYLRQHGKDMLMVGGFKMAASKHKPNSVAIELNIPLRIKLVIILILIAALSYVI